MAKALLGLAALMLLSPGLVGAQAKTFTGDIMDSGCAKNGSHAQMEKMHKMPPSSALTGNEAKMCTDACVKMGSQYVLYNPATKTVYQLDDQTKPADFAGQRVRVTGTYDPGTHTIHVESIHK